MTKRQKLGRGLGSLLGETLDEKGKVIDLELAKIHPNPWQPRRDFDDEALKGLADSIKEKGLIQPVTVRYKDTDGEFEYELVAGERRFRAAKMAGLSVIPAIITQYDDKMMAEAALIENLQREDLNPVEEASAYETIMKSYELTQEELAESVGKSRSHVANTLRLMDLPDEVKDMLSERKCNRCYNTSWKRHPRRSSIVHSVSSGCKHRQVSFLKYITTVPSDISYYRQS